MGRPKVGTNIPASILLLLAKLPGGIKDSIYAIAGKLHVGRALLRRYEQVAIDPFVDVFLISFPKCGRTWLSLMLGKVFTLRYELRETQLLELHRLARSYPDVPRIKVTHDDNPFWKIPSELEQSKQKYQDRKVILLIRDPRDVIVSSYFQKARRMRRYEGDLSSYIREERGGLDTLVRWYNIWADSRHLPSNLLLVRYEDMHQDAEAQLRRVLEFLNLDHIPSELVREAVQYASFDNMRRLELQNGQRSFRLRPKKLGDPESFKTRKGKVGGYLEYLSDEDVEFVNCKLGELSDFYSEYKMSQASQYVGT